MSRSRTRTILGTIELGRRALVEDGPCHEMLEEFFNRGYKELDSSHWNCGGRTDEIIGRYFAEKTNYNKAIVSTKVNPFDYTLTRADVLKQANISLESLRTSCVDILYLHAPDHNTPIEETLEAVQHLYMEGKFKEFGVCNYASWEVVEIYHICKSKGWVLPTVYQGMYNPITRMVEAELFPALRHSGIRFYAFNPLAGGLLTGRYSKADMEKEQEGRFWTVGYSKTYRGRYWRESTFDGLDLVHKALDEAYGKGVISLLRATFRWMNHHSKLEENDGIAFGCSSLSQMSANLDACEEGPLDQCVVDAFDKAWEMDKANCAGYFSLATH